MGLDNEGYGKISHILFLRSLGRCSEKHFGRKAIDALVKAMEDNKDNLVLILPVTGDTSYKGELFALISADSFVIAHTKE